MIYRRIGGRAPPSIHPGLRRGFQGIFQYLFVDLDLGQVMAERGTTDRVYRLAKCLDQRDPGEKQVKHTSLP